MTHHNQTKELTTWFLRMGYLERRQHFLRDHVEKEDIEMRYIATERQLADIFNKPLDASRFAALRGRGVGVCHPEKLSG
jgi:hypothetical protein